MSKDKNTKRKRFNKFENENENKKNKTEEYNESNIIEIEIVEPPLNFNKYDNFSDDDFKELDSIYYDKEYLNISLKNIDDLIEIGNKYLKGYYCPYTIYNINVRKLGCLVNPLNKLKKMVGMDNIKHDVFNLLLYQLQEFDNSKDMLHTIIEGEPGVGKTELAKILSEIYQEMGYCNNEIIKFVKRSDLIGGYLGQTAIKTQKVLDECKGGILVIDEAYSLGNSDKTDSYSKECIDTLTRFLSESPDTIVFIMGYKEALQRCLFNHNKGLERRFTYRFSIDKYLPNQLKQILIKIIKENNWFIENENDLPEYFFLSK